MIYIAYLLVSLLKHPEVKTIKYYHFHGFSDQKYNVCDSLLFSYFESPYTSLICLVLEKSSSKTYPVFDLHHLN